MKKVIILSVNTLEAFHRFSKIINNYFALPPQYGTLLAAFGELRCPGLHPANSTEGVDKITNTIVDKMKILTPTRDCLVLTANEDGLRMGSGNLAEEQLDLRNKFFLNDDSTDKETTDAFFSLYKRVGVIVK